MTGTEGQTLTATGAALYSEEVAAVLSSVPDTPPAQPTVSSPPVTGKEDSKVAPGETVQFSAAELHSSPPFETSFEDLLRSSGIVERVTQNIRAQEITTRPLFVGLTHRRKVFWTRASPLVSMPSTAFRTKENIPSYSQAWDTARVQHETKVQVDSAARAHGQPVTLIEADWAVLRGFRERFGKRIPCFPISRLSQPWNVNEERVASGSLRTEPLTTLLSLEEETRFKDRHPEAGKQFSLSVDSKFTIQSSKRILSSISVSTIEDQRDKYRVMSNLWLLAQVRQPGRHLNKDFTKDTFPEFLEELIGARNFRMDREEFEQTRSCPPLCRTRSVHPGIPVDSLRRSRAPPSKTGFSSSPSPTLGLSRQVTGTSTRRWIGVWRSLKNEHPARALAGRGKASNQHCLQALPCLFKQVQRRKGRTRHTKQKEKTKTERKGSPLYSHRVRHPLEDHWGLLLFLRLVLSETSPQSSKQGLFETGLFWPVSVFRKDDATTRSAGSRTSVWGAALQTDRTTSAVASRVQSELWISSL